MFKDYLILDDISEFLKRYYTTHESSIRLPRFLEYYDKYSRIFPNYTVFLESKYIYKNIHKKQKMIDQQQNAEHKKEKKVKRKDNTYDNGNDTDDNNQVFSTEVCNSIANDSSYMNYLFGLQRKNNNKCVNMKSKDDNINNISVVNDSLVNVNKIISLINDLEHKHNKLQYVQHNTINNHTHVNTHITLIKPKHPTLIINNKHACLHANATNTHKSVSISKPHKEKHINLSHRGSFFSSSYSKRKCPISHNKKNYNTNTTNCPITNRTSYKPSKDVDRVRLNINFNNTPSYICNRKSPRTDQFKRKIKEILLKNIHINSNNTSRHRHRNHNCLLSSKGQMFTSRTNNNSISNNTNSTVYYSNVNKQQFMTLSSRNANTAQVSDDSRNSKNKKVNANSKSVFDFNLLRKYITISQSKSKSKPKHSDNDVKHDIKKNNNNITSKERYKIKSGIINSKLLLPAKKTQSKIPGIHIKGFNKLFEYHGRNKHEHITHSKDTAPFHTIKTHHTSTPKISNVSKKIKYNK